LMVIDYSWVCQGLQRAVLTTLASILSPI
jgi:hypothetical protein